ncbi:MAG: hypothetical protein VYE61_01760, partial [Pseudomonadota bacterium]|nr:hypothetical protein [Pseudomonadota bacterium]
MSKGLGLWSSGAGIEGLLELAASTLRLFLIAGFAAAAGPRAPAAHADGRAGEQQHAAGQRRRVGQRARQRARRARG